MAHLYRCMFWAYLQDKGTLTTEPGGIGLIQHVDVKLSDAKDLFKWYHFRVFASVLQITSRLSSQTLIASNLTA